MKKTIKHIALCFSLFVSLLSTSQNELKGYRIEGDTIVFRFDKSDYIQATNERTGKRLDFKDFKIKKVVLSGKFNEWSREGWKMKSVGQNVFELRKSLSDLDPIKQEFKFFINDSYWAEPTRDFVNITPARGKMGIPYQTYNLNILSAFPKKNGNVTFFLKGYLDAEKVIVTGTFSRWNTDFFEMKKVKDGWRISLQLPPKLHQYRFVVDGQWMEDPSNENRILNKYNGYNSLINIKKDVEFFLPNSLKAKKVILSGSFNGWNEHELEMKKTEKGWRVKLALAGGKHHYKFIVDGLWLTDPQNKIREYDDEGNINSVIMVK